MSAMLTVFCDGEFFSAYTNNNLDVLGSRYIKELGNLYGNEGIFINVDGGTIFVPASNKKRLEVFIVGKEITISKPVGKTASVPVPKGQKGVGTKNTFSNHLDRTNQNSLVRAETLNGG